MNILLDDVPCLCFGFNDNGVITVASGTLCSTLGYSKEQLVGNKADTIFTMSTRIFNQTHLLPLLKIQGYANEIFITLKAVDGSEVPLLMNATIKEVDGENNTMITGIIVHNRKKYEDEIIAAKKAAEKALNDNSVLVQLKDELEKRIEQLDNQVYLVKRQNEELKQFNRVVTHDLEEPLRKLLMFSNIFLQSNKDTDPRPVIEKLQRTSQQMRTTVSGLQQYVWLTEASLHISQVNLNAILLTAKRKVERDYPDAQLQLVTSELPAMEGDREQILLLVQELLTNAVKFRKSGNRVTVRVDGKVLQLNRYRSVEGKYKYADFLRLEMHDDGIGFDSKFKHRIFELFKGLHPSSGKGVGLSLCKKIVENHYGDISIDGTVNEGTTVTLLLPLQQQEGKLPSVNENLTSVTDEEQQ